MRQPVMKGEYGFGFLLAHGGGGCYVIDNFLCYVYLSSNRLFWISIWYYIFLIVSHAVVATTKEVAEWRESRTNFVKKLTQQPKSET